jgi:hypothetical protein
LLFTFSPALHQILWALMHTFRECMGSLNRKSNICLILTCDVQ